MTVMDELARKLKAVQALAEQGFGGEKENAQRLLEKLMDKYGVSDKELEAAEVETCWFAYSQEIERRLLAQIIYMVTGKGSYGCVGSNGGRKHKKLGVDCTKAEWFEIKTNYAFFKAALEKELDVFMSAFANKNHLFPETDKRENVPERKISDEELEKISMMSMGIDQYTLKKALPEGAV